MIKTNFSIDSILGTKCDTVTVVSFSLDGDGDSGRSQCSNSPLLQQPPSSSSSTSLEKDELKGPFCAKCKLHSEYFLVKNHKDRCKRRFCKCKVCKLIDEGKTLRGKKKKIDSSACRSDRFDRDRPRRNHEDIMTMAGNFKGDLKRFISTELGPDAGKMAKLLNSVLYLLLQRNRFDANTLKKKLSIAKRVIEDLRQGRNCNIMGGINSFHGESSEVVASSSPPLTERLTLDHRPRHLSSSSGTTFSPQSLTCLSTSPNTIIIPTNLPMLSRPGSITSPTTGIPGGTGTSLTFAPTHLTSTVTGGTTNTSSGSSSSTYSSISSSSSITSVPVSSSSSASSSATTAAAAAAAAAAASSILSLSSGTEYPVTAIPQPTMFTSSLFCPTYPFSPLVTSGPLQAPYQTTSTNCPTGIIPSPSSSPVKNTFSPQHPGCRNNNNHGPNSTIGTSSNFNRTNHNVSIQLAESIAKSTNHHLHHQIHQHTTSLYSFLGSNSGAINLSKRLN